MVTGSLQERNGKYVIFLNLYPNGKGGKRKQKTISIGLPVKGNKRKAQELLEEYKRRYSGEEVLTDDMKSQDSPLFAEFLREWLRIVKPTIERTTYDSYASMINSRLDKHFRRLGVTLAEVEAKHIRQLHESILKDGCKANTVHRYHAVVRSALNYAEKNELIEKNPVKHIKLPKKDKFISEYYTKTEMAELFEATKEEPLAVVIRLAAYYGLRRSEALGVRWSNVDFERKTISINHKVISSKENGKRITFTEDKLKTDSSFRTLPLIPVVVEYLLEVKARQERYRRLFKRSYCTGYLDYGCVDQMGELIKPDYVSRRFSELLQKYGLKKIRFHDLRHSCASLLLSEGIPIKAIQEWLGHSNFSTTADIYSHLDFSSKVESGNVINTVFSAGNTAPDCGMAASV